MPESELLVAASIIVSGANVGIDFGTLNSRFAEDLTGENIPSEERPVEPKFEKLVVVFFIAILYIYRSENKQRL